MKKKICNLNLLNCYSLLRLSYFLFFVILFFRTYLAVNIFRYLCFLLLFVTEQCLKDWSHLIRPFKLAQADSRVVEGHYGICLGHQRYDLGHLLIAR